MYLVKVISSKIDKARRRVVKLLKSGKNDTRTAFAVQPFGYDGAPVKNDDLIGVYAYTGRRGDSVLIGYINRNSVAEAGEVRLYSTNAQAKEQAYLYFRKDGVCEVNGNSDNFVRFSDMKKAFDQFLSDFNAHTQTGNLGAPTSPPIKPSAANMDSSKTQNVETE